MLKIEPPKKLDFARPQEWPEWKQCFGHFRCATKLDQGDKELQVNALIYTTGKGKTMYI